MLPIFAHQLHPAGVASQYSSHSTHCVWLVDEFWFWEPMGRDRGLMLRFYESPEQHPKGALKLRTRFCSRSNVVSLIIGCPGYFAISDCTLDAALVVTRLWT
jgi:hypothetical protein